MNLLAELKRRNVIRMAGLYLVGAWLVTQVSSTVLPTFDVPSWVLRALIIVLAVGFVPALIFAWVFELTPEGLKRDAEVTPEESIAPQTARRMDRLIIAMLILALVYFAFDKFALAPRREAAMLADAQRPASSPQPRAKSIAVLPFTDLSPGHDQEYFSDGMAEEILNALAQIKDLKVAGRTSSFYYKGKNEDLRAIGKALGVANILEGSVRKQGEKVRITAQLIQASDDSHLWSQAFDGDVSDVFELQERIARAITDQLKVVLQGDQVTRLVPVATANADAYALFVEAQTLVNRRVGDSLPQAIALLQKATALDPKFARAWSKLAIAYAVLAQYVSSDWRENWNASDHAAQNALALDPNDAEAYTALSYNQFSQRHYVAMVEPMRRALELGPDDLAANYWAANELAATGRTRDAEAQIDSMLPKDPANTLLLFYKGSLRWRAGDVAAAMAIARRIEDRGAAFATLILAWHDATVGDFDAGAKHFAFARGLGTTLSPADLEAVYRGSYQGETQRRAALAILDAHAADDWTPTFLLQLSEPERSFDLYEHGHSGLSDAYLNWLWQPETWSRKARQSSAFQGFAKRIGLLDYWKQNRWPDLCSPTPKNGPDGFTCK